MSIAAGSRSYANAVHRFVATRAAPKRKAVTHASSHAKTREVAHAVASRQNLLLFTRYRKDLIRITVNPQNDIAQHPVAAFERDGFLVLHNSINQQRCAALREYIIGSLDPLVGPAEYEADVGYPGSPESRDAPGGTTPRRLLHAYARCGLLRDLARHPGVRAQLTALFACEPLLSQCHHNCVMTKHPGFSSMTLWHQDIRYWSFDRPELISVWFALQDENEDNGALLGLPAHILSIWIAVVWIGICFCVRSWLKTERLLKPALADIAPGADNVGNDVDGQGHGVHSMKVL